MLLTRAVVHGWSLAVIAALVAAFGGWYVASSAPDVYASQTRLLVGPLGPDHDALRSSELLVNTYAELVATDSVLQAALGHVGVVMSSSDFRDDVDATADGGTRMLTIRVTNGDPRLSATLADALANEVRQFAGEIDSTSAASTSIVDGAEVGKLVEDQAVLMGLLSGVAGGLFGIAPLLIVSTRRRAEANRALQQQTAVVYRNGAGERSPDGLAGMRDIQSPVSEGRR